MTTDTNDPLAGLDTIDWAALGHAYGAADDVPGQLRALCGADEDGREKALIDLYGNIFHQGSRYQASAVAVPFLARMAADASLPGRPEVLGLLASLAIGYDEAHLPGGVDVAGCRRETAEFRAKGPARIRAEYDAWVAEAAGEGERRVREIRREAFDFDDQLRYLETELGVYDAVRAEVPGLRALLDDGDPAVRAATAYLLAWFPEEAAPTLPRLLRLLDREPVPAVLATALVAAGLLGDAELVERLRPFLATEDRAVRWAAATALARLGSAEAGVLAELAAAETDPPEPGAPDIPFHDGDLRGYAAAGLTLLADHYPAEALDAVTTGLAATSGPAAFAITAAALRLAFGPQRPAVIPAFAELGERQQRLLRVLASLDSETWRWVNFLEILGAWGLPQDRPALRAYAGMAAE
ncbi:HEAT repeat domain-containing protein [Kitasatospora sp. NPDC088351]|uniref:HEAT repeat domain-containing protein n=1 Tax=Kitasatospora sp. NPDC088351 TaxID=3155180 RepID=UPI0034400DB2